MSGSFLVAAVLKETVARGAGRVLLGNELSNVPGMRFTTSDMKTCNIVINIDNEIMIAAFKNLGYRLITQSQYPNNARAPGAPIFHFTVDN